LRDLRLEVLCDRPGLGRYTGIRWSPSKLD